MSPFTVREITARDMFDAAVDVEWAAMSDPFRPEFPWLHPVEGHMESDREASVREDKDRRWQQHVANPASHWVAVTDDASGQVIGTAEWQIHTQNPFPGGPVRLRCTWFPDGETQDFVTEVINQCYYTRMNWMDRPHISLNEMAVLPKHRRCGVGSSIMRWGLQKAEEMNLECFLEASDLGKDLYERFGFQTLMTFAVNAHKKDASQTWTRLHNEFPAITCTCMWRPSPSDLRSGAGLSFWDVFKRWHSVHVITEQMQQNAAGVIFDDDCDLPTDMSCLIRPSCVKAVLWRACRHVHLSRSVLDEKSDLVSRMLSGTFDQLN